MCLGISYLRNRVVEEDLGSAVAVAVAVLVLGLLVEVLSKEDGWRIELSVLLARSRRDSGSLNAILLQDTISVLFYC
ncbi:hypothetical protein RHGRI_017821 [Rhododendron griersonianum]|uniref:Uncharacterized protein n=1 Tax=Rhododendron griersonianum TaxID=479676 RepID=A0AAV6JZ96_9ERIC|nr:hypothetical protein RHGRI_017821 [Rhododendron griersonianum]